MNQRRGLERLTGGLRGHLCHSQFAEFIVNQWQKFLPRLWVPLLDAIEDLRHVAHETARYQKRTGCTSLKQWGPATEQRRCGPRLIQECAQARGPPVRPVPAPLYSWKNQNQ